MLLCTRCITNCLVSTPYNQHAALGLALGLRILPPPFGAADMEN